MSRGGVLLAVLSAVLAAGTLLLVTAPARPWLTPRRAGRWPLAALVVLGTPVIARAEPRLLVLGVLGGAGAVAAERMLRARRRTQEEAGTRARVVELCEQVAADLGAGSPPAVVLRRAAEEWAALAPVAEAAVVGSDVPTAWRLVAQRPGARDLDVIAAAWQVAHRAGDGLADSVAQVADGLRSEAATRALIDGELASARATVRLVAVLPVLALLMASGSGGDPIGFLTGTPAGLACLAAGLALAGAGVAWVERLARHAAGS